jgi:hypothetical protein
MQVDRRTRHCLAAGDLGAALVGGRTLLHGPVGRRTPGCGTVAGVPRRLPSHARTWWRPTPGRLEPSVRGTAVTRTVGTQPLAAGSRRRDTRAAFYGVRWVLPFHTGCLFAVRVGIDRGSGMRSRAAACRIPYLNVTAR